MKKSILVAVFTLLFVTAFSVQAQGFMPWTEVFVMADTSGDGMITMVEIQEFQTAHTEVSGFSPWASQNFDAMDTNDDGMVTMHEMKVYTMSMKMTDSQVTEGFYKGFGFMPRNQ
ncbi:MAG: hypothetical protein L0Y67_02005 [Gammaproteobacteria bacterium]|nr:hypothetical protein [Gammaproteobacteria bacterium]MCI0590373.1 hypothetical protein [Gammaproteobacteria bacterium]